MAFSAAASVMTGMFRSTLLSCHVYPQDHQYRSIVIVIGQRVVPYTSVQAVCALGRLCSVIMVILEDLLYYLWMILGVFFHCT